VRNDLRQDLPKLDLLRTYPLSGAAIVAAEVAASTVTLTALQLALGALAYVILLDSETGLRLGDRTLLLAAAAVALPALNLVSLAIHNGLALLYPDWGKRGQESVGGVETLGLSMVTMFGSLLLVLAALVVPVALAALAALALRPTLGGASVAAAGAVAIAALAGEAALLVRWLGRVFERTEPGLATSGA
jgi:hypothetical protein